MAKKYLKYLKLIVIPILIIAIGTGGLVLYKKFNSKSTSVSSTVYSREKVVKTNLEVTVEATGTISGADAVNVFSSITGVVQGLTVKEGDIVKKGDVFCKIDASTTEQEVKNAKLSLEKSKLELQALENQLESLYVKAPIDGKITKVFVEPGDNTSTIQSTYGGMAVMTAGSDDSLEITIPFSSSGKIAEVYVSPGKTVKKGDILFKFDDTSLKNNIAQKKLEIQQAENNLKEKEADLSKTTIVAPVSGVVTALEIKNGEIVDDSKLMATITDTSKMQVTIPVDELDINKVKVGQKASIKVDDVDGKTFEGKVESISHNGVTSNNITTYDVVVSIDNPENLKIGMNADVTISIESKENVLAVPQEAIIEKNGKKYVMIANNETQNTDNKTVSRKLVEVQTGIKTTSMIEITSGLSEGQIVLVQLNTNSNSNNNRMQGFPGDMGMGGMPGGGMPSGGMSNRSKN
ncbi:efflux RND transporter periplasmic adaptor subunit [Caloramator sp. E03]|uniref:efflux RND transporter periplasmic adaptor subunit n=1 Tax=Caloramator sp. E03 TaxID=2576307 RepID=UPI001110EC17|nr:efflux RND transporter periplasmic adaptor subunit [Caloramator sp. E03]QCX32849.1 efflux RND transporter periplasmic adaptor subunit [Caloramator sp. E03]